MNTKPTTRTSDESPSAFQWNQGGWFGALLGGTCWMPLTAGVVAGADALAAGLVLLFYVAAIFYGIRLWKRRADLPPYPAIQRLITVEGLCALAAVVSLHLRDAWQFLPETGRAPIWTMYAALLIFPAMLVKFHLQERAARS
ncbi:MAG: hypothetical protein H6831_05445 [Planctomycetes bacterium]|nr:hypothetical protein [Planctomycetota bacterium]MCB9903833.1 hypothetical protein [Planctomycetota bacterium]